MTQRPTNDDLIRLVQEKPAEDLSGPETEQLRQRLAESPELRHVLLDQLHLETYLNRALGDVRVSIDDIVRRAQSAHVSRFTQLSACLIGLGFAMVVAFVGAAHVFPEWLKGPDPLELAALADAADLPETADDGDEDSVPDEVARSEEASESGQAEAEVAASDAASSEPKAAKTEGPPEVAAAAPQVEVAQAPAAEVAKAEVEVAPEPPPIPAGPWSAALADDRPPRPFVETAFDDPLLSETTTLPADELRKWLGPVEGRPHHIQDAPHRRWSTFQGWAKLQAPWPDDAVLRLGLFQFTEMKLHFWNGDEGLTLQWFQHARPQIWAAYRTTRKPATPEPERLALLTTDDGRHVRSGLGTFELRHQEGMLVMTRGDVRLLSVPLAAPPQEVYFEGTSQISVLTMYRGEPVPPAVENPRPNVLPSTEPAELKWLETLVGGAKFNKSGDGSVELIVNGNGTDPNGPTRTAWAATPLARPGLYEIIARVEGTQPGTGLYLGDAQGHPVHHIAFFRNQQTGGTTFGYGWSTYGYVQPNNVRVQENSVPNIPVPYADEGQWLRIVVGSGTLKLWTSGDGVHWGRAMSAPAPDIRGPVASVGLFVLSGAAAAPLKEEGKRSVRLSRLEVRELTSLTSLADGDLRGRVPPFSPDDLADYQQWLHRTVEDLPAGTGLVEWRRTCAVIALEQGAAGDVARTLLRGLLDEGAALAETVERRLQLLDEIALIGDFWADPPGGEFASEYVRLALGAAEAGEPQAFGLLSPALIASPLWTQAVPSAVPLDVVREGVLTQVYASRWEETCALCGQWRFWMRNANPVHVFQGEDQQKTRLMDWGAAVAASHRPAAERGNAPTLLREWRHPLLTQLSKEGYNVMAEFESALASRAWEDACQIIAAASTAETLGLLPDAKDPELLVSLPRRVALAMRDHPPLRRTMQERFGRLSLLRVRQAMADADADTVRAAVIQFYGTEAAAEAHRWLGDQALSAGQFARAVEHYREAVQDAPPALERDVSSRLRLASALMGQPAGEPPRGPVELGELSLTPGEFESLITEMTEQRGSAGIAMRPASGPANGANVPAPARFKTHVRGKFDGNLGNNAGSGGSQDTDWMARQLAVAVDDETMYVSNRFQVVAYNPQDGGQKWSQGLGGEQGEAHHWPFLAMRPVIAGDRLFVRRLTKQGPELACLERETGNVLWRSRPDNQVASDPVLARGRLLALVALSPQPGEVQFDIVTFHSESGDVLSQKPLMRLRDVWGMRPPVQIVEADGRIVCTVGASVACFDLLGEPHWLRRQHWLPAELDPDARHVHLDPPLVIGAGNRGRVFVLQPGVRAVSCLELATGREFWTRPVPSVVRLLGLAGDRLILQTAGALQALDRQTGELLWRHATGRVLDAQVCGDEGLVYACRVELEPNSHHPCLVWVDPQTGSELARELLRDLHHRPPVLGPLVGTEGRLWTFFGTGPQDARRDLVELVPQEAPAPGPLAPSDFADWPVPAALRDRQDVAGVLPGWTLVTAQPKGAGWQAEHRGEQDVLATRSENGRPVRFVRRLDVPDEENPKFRLRVGCQPDAGWTLSVLVNGEEAVSEVIEDSAPNGWKDVEVDLAPHAGRTVWIVVSHTSIKPGRVSLAFWKRLEFP